MPDRMIPALHFGKCPFPLDTKDGARCWRLKEPYNHAKAQREYEANMRRAGYEPAPAVTREEVQARNSNTFTEDEVFI